MSEKTRVLWVSDSSVATHTGFGKVSWEILSRLSRNENLEIAELGGANPSGSRHGKDPAWFIYPSGTSRICEDRFLPVVQHFKPQVVISLYDAHMSAYMNDYTKVPLAVRDSFKGIAHLPIDGSPAPSQWLDLLTGWNHIACIHPYGQQVLLEGYSEKISQMVQMYRVSVNGMPEGSEPSPELQQLYWKIQSYMRICDNISVIAHGVNREVYRPAEDRHNLRLALGFKEDDFIFCFIGRNSIRKMVPTLLAAFKEVHRKHPRAHLILGCARQDSGANLDDVISHYKVDPHSVTIMDNKVLAGKGMSDEGVAELYQMSDCFVSPAYGGGFEMCHLESMACGLPQIGVEGAGSITEMVKGHGILVPAEKWYMGGDMGPHERPLVTPRKLAKAMCQMINSPAKLASWSEASLQYAESDCFDWDTAAADFEELIQKVLLDDSTAMEGLHT